MEIQDLQDYLFENKYAFLIGNGINLAHGGKDWKSLLKSVIDETLGAGSYLADAIGKEGITNTEIQNIIPLEYNRKKGKNISVDELMEIVCSNVEEINYESSSVTFLNWIQNAKCDILTTNFDLNIEQYLWGSHRTIQSVNKNKSYTSSSSYPWDKFYRNNQDKSQENGCRVWHIHGDILHQKSIILSINRYMHAVKQAIKILYNQIDSPDWCGSNTWLDIFFKKPLVIVGLKLDPQELFLRWLLIQRATRMTGRNLPPSFYLTRGDLLKEAPGKLKFLNFLGIEVIQFPQNSLYNHPIWERYSKESL